MNFDSKSLIFFYYLIIMMRTSFCFLKSINSYPRNLFNIHSISKNLISVKNTQKNVSINKNQIIQSTFKILEILNVSDFNLDIWFCSEAKIRELNREHRGFNKSTDILSFPINDFEKPELFIKDACLEFERHLGDLVIAPSYVLRQCINDKETLKGEIDELDQGVSRAMSKIYNVEDRFPLLIIHGILHLLG